MDSTHIERHRPAPRRTALHTTVCQPGGPTNGLQTRDDKHATATTHQTSDCDVFLRVAGVTRQHANRGARNRVIEAARRANQVFLAQQRALIEARQRAAFEARRAKVFADWEEMKRQRAARKSGRS